MTIESLYKRKSGKVEKNGFQSWKVKEKSVFCDFSLTFHDWKLLTFFFTEIESWDILGRSQGLLKSTAIKGMRCGVFKFIQIVCIFMRIGNHLTTSHVTWHGGTFAPIRIIPKEIPKFVSLIVCNDSSFCYLIIRQKLRENTYGYVISIEVCVWISCSSVSEVSQEWEIKAGQRHVYWLCFHASKVREGNTLWGDPSG